MYAKIRSGRFLFWWVVASVLVYPVAAIIGGSMLPIVGIMGGMFSTGGNNDVLNFLYGFLALLIIGAAVGFSVGLLQSNLLRNRLHWTADHWMKYSAIGGGMGTLAYMGLLSMLGQVGNSALISGYNRSTEWTLLLLMPAFAGGVALAQWFALRQAVQHAWLWVLGNVAAGIAYSGIIAGNLPEAYVRDYDLRLLAVLGLAVIVQGVVTGFVMLHLFEKHSYPIETDQDELAYVPVPIENNRKKSVWDDAI
jgi:hypothetical protein